MNRSMRAALLSLLAVIAVSCAPKSEKASQTAATESAAPKVETRLLKKWMIGLANRRPGLGATKVNTLGMGALGITTSGDATSWYEMVDVDSSGRQEKIGFMWDGASKIMYAYTKDPVTLADGTVADKGLLVTQFGANNTKGKPEGSGWYAYATERDSSVAGIAGKLYGCTFDAAGNILQCGEGTFDRKGDEFNISVKPQ
jgi:hypothetical protein